MQPPISSELLRAIAPERTPLVGASDDREWESWAKREDVIRQQAKLSAVHKRDQQAKQLIHYAILGNIIVIGFCLAIAFVIRAVHLLVPVRWLWLDKGQVETLDTLAKLVTTGALGSLLTRYLNKNVDNGNSEKAS